MKKAILCFTRVPRPGQTKTRLLPVLSPQQCADLHRAFLQDLHKIYSGLEADLLVAYTDDPQWQELQRLLPGATAFFPQEGVDLGERMHHALCRAFSMGYSAVVLTGSDLPELTADLLNDAFSGLDKADVVLGPTPDGGYFLVGMKTPCKEVFLGHKYGGSTVLESTCAAIQTAGKTLWLTAPCNDVDTPEDLLRLKNSLSPDSFTGKFLKKVSDQL